MNSLRKWFYRPRRDDQSLLAQFYYSDEELNLVAGELDSFDGRKDPERCTSLVNQLRQCQDKVLNICIEMMDELLPEERSSRDFRVKFPDDVMQETLSGQLWFGAECLAAGSSILNRESESTKMRPLAKAVTKTIESVRNLLREQCLKPIPEYTEKIRESLRIFDRLFSDFELSYVSAMVPVKTVEEHDMQQNVVVLFSDTLQRASKLGLVVQDQIDNYDPALMFTIPRLAIVAGLVIFRNGPLNLEKESKNLSELFRPFKTLLHKIRELLCTMTPQELATLEKCLCSMDEPEINIQSLKDQTISSELYGPVAFTSELIQKFYTNYPSCRQLTPEMTSLCTSTTKKTERSDRKRDRHSSKASRLRARQERQSERFLSRLTGIEERPKAKRRSRRVSSASQYYHHGDADHLNDYWHQNGSRRSARRSIPLPPNGNPSRNEYYMEYDARHPPPPPPSYQSTRHRTTRQYNRSSRHRRDRINTITCACGSSSIHIPVHEEYFHYSEDQSHYTPESTSVRVNPIYRGPNYALSDDYRERCPYENTQYNDENLVQPIANAEDSSNQSSIRDIVLSTMSVVEESSILNTESACEEILSQPPTDHIADKTINSQSAAARKSIDIDLSSCSCDTICDKEEILEDLDSPSKSMETDSKCDNCSCNSEDAIFELPTEDHLIPPVPSVRSIHTSFRPYGEICHEESNEVTGRDLMESRDYISKTESKDESIADELVSSGSTSPHQSGAEDDEEVALALQAAEVAISWKARERFADPGDLIQRLFVCISGVADQLQTNYASDLRKILRAVFLMNQTPDSEPEEEVEVPEDKDHFPTNGGDLGAEDVTSSNGSEQLSVESAEDALIGIGTPEESERVDFDEESSNHSESLEDDVSPLMRTISVIVPPSVFTDHSMLQYSAMSPPPMSLNHSNVSGNDSFSNQPGTANTQVPSSSSEVNVPLEPGTSVTADMNQLSITSPGRTYTGDFSGPGDSNADSRRYPIVQEPPSWIPDDLAPRCMACGAMFTVVRRKHHCRNCGKVFCGHCSRHNVPLPHFGIWKNVRVCNACFLYYVTSSADGSAALS